MNKQSWKERFRDEFGIHFSPSELQFCEAFIEDELSAQREEIVEIMEGMKFNITDKFPPNITYSNGLDLVKKKGWNEAIDDILSATKGRKKDK